MSDVDAKIAQMLSDESITAADADAIRTFGNFLRDAGPAPTHPDHDPTRLSAAYREHYPEDFARAVEEHQQPKATDG